MNKRTLMIGGLLAVLLLGSIGAVLTSAQNSTGTPQTTDTWPTPQGNDTRPFPGNMSRSTMMPQGHGFGFAGGLIPPGANLTAAQLEEINATIAALRQQNASFDQTRQAIYSLLESYGVYDAQLNASISNTQRRLTILNREKDLRSQGYNWTTIQTMITEEFGQNATGYNPETPMMMHDHHGFGGRGGPGPQCGGRPEQ